MGLQTYNNSIIQKIYTDFDGTLSKGYISMEFMDFLFFEKLYHKKAYSAQMQALRDYKQGRINYDVWCERWGELWAAGMKGNNSLDIDVAAKEFYELFRKNIYSSSYTLIDSLKKISEDISIISVGASEVISLAAKDLGITRHYSTLLERTDKYTGRIVTDIHVDGGKKKILERDKGKFLGLGDSRGDIGFLELAAVPVVMNPDKIMREHALNRGWLILDSLKSSDALVKDIYSRLT